MKDPPLPSAERARPCRPLHFRLLEPEENKSLLCYATPLVAIGYSSHRKGTVQHTSRGHLVRGCVCPVGTHCLHAAVTASPGLCTTAEQIFVRSGANSQGRGWGVGESGCKGQARPRGLDPFTFTGNPWKYSGTNASEAFPALSTRGHQGIRTIAWSSSFQQTGPSPSPDSGEGPVPLGLS